jgi:hypothetical protein
MQAQAERERQARVILGDSERQIARNSSRLQHLCQQSERVPFAGDEHAVRGLKQNSTIVIVPSTAVESMQLGSIAGLTALTMGLGQKPSSARRRKRNFC